MKFDHILQTVFSIPAVIKLHVVLNISVYIKYLLECKTIYEKLVNTETLHCLQIDINSKYTGVPELTVYFIKGLV